jgi:hypothetical protein
LRAESGWTGDTEGERATEHEAEAEQKREAEAGGKERKREREWQRTGRIRAIERATEERCDGDDDGGEWAGARVGWLGLGFASALCGVGRLYVGA